MRDRLSLQQRLDALLLRDHRDIHPAEVEALALELFRWQRAHNPVYARIADATLDGAEPVAVDDIPAVPTDVFKAARVACFAPERAVRVFRTSGTTHETRGEHAFDTLTLYEHAALSSARRWLLPEARYAMALLAEREEAAPDSSLTFMLARFAERWDASCGAFCIAHGAVDAARVQAAVARAWAEGIPAAILGASYGFVHLADALDGASLRLPPGSVVMPTGGFKGRSRELDPAAFVATLQGLFDVPREAVVGEYGMTELSSQAYEAWREGSHRYRAPPWMRVTAVDPVTLARLPDGATGLLRVLDLANIGSAICLQTADLGRVWSDGFEVLGRAPGATPRGCARALDAALSRDDAG